MKFISVFLLCLIPFFTVANTSLPDGRHIVVTGSAELEVKPDIAIVSFRVKAIKPKSIEAKNDVDKRVNSFLAGLPNFNVDEDNVSASNLSTSQNSSYKNGKKIVDGYSAQRTLKVTLNDVSVLNKFINFALTVGINNITDISFGSSNANTFKDEVNILAVENAKSKAASLANAFGAKLSKIYSINSTSYGLRNRLGRNLNVDSIVAGNFGSTSGDSEGQYLQENIVFSSSINAVFSIKVN